MLRSRPAAGLGGRAHLLLRVHLLPRLRGGRAPRPLPQLRRRAAAAPPPAPGQAREVSGLDGPRAQARGLPELTRGAPDARARPALRRLRAAARHGQPGRGRARRGRPLRRGHAGDRPRGRLQRDRLRAALHRRLPGAGLPRRLTLETRAGVLPVTVEAGGTGEPVVIMAQPPARFESFEGDPAGLARVLGLGPDDLRTDLPILYGNTGVWTLLVPVHGLGTMRRMKPLTAEFPSVLAGRAGASIHPFCIETIHPDAHLHARHFSSPRSGTVEDPVTGTASGVLGAYHRAFIEAGEAGPSHSPLPFTSPLPF